MMRQDPESHASNALGLPRQVGDGLWLRQATKADTEALAAFNVRIHSDDPAQPETWIAVWTRDLMSGRHPTTSAADFTLVTDEGAEGKIVSTLALLAHTWSYDGISIGVGRPELVGTDPAYRRRGLVGRQMHVAHQWSEARGDMIQAITGIPWYYRRFGYEMALTLGGSRMIPQERMVTLLAAKDPPLRVRAATTADVPALKRLYDVHRKASMISLLRDDAAWEYDMKEAGAETSSRRDFFIVEGDEGESLGYFEYRNWPNAIAVREMGVEPGYSWREVALTAVRHLKEEQERREQDDGKLYPVSFVLGLSHPLYDALGQDLVPGRNPYAWYLRVPDLPAFLRQIAPVLARRLATSVVAGYSGTVRLSLYTDHLALLFRDGSLLDVKPFPAEHIDDGDVLFPDLTFLQLLFGYRSLSSLRNAFADCIVRKEEHAILLDALFPQRPSNPLP